MKIENAMETYTQIKKRHSDEFAEFPIAFAFSEKQLQQALEKLNANKEDCMSVGAGSILRKSDYASFKALRERHEAEMKQFMSDDNSLMDAIIYELGNHEYGYTGDPSDTIRALGLNMKDERVSGCFKTARNRYMELNADNF